MKIKDRLLGRELTPQQKEALHEVFESIPLEGIFGPADLSYRKYKRKEIAWIGEVKIERIQTRKGVRYTYTNITEDQSKVIQNTLLNSI